MEKCLVLVGKAIKKNILLHYDNLNLKFKIYVVTPVIIDEYKYYKNLIFIEDSFFLKKNDHIIKTNRPNWYFQQFLKYMIILKLNEKNIHLIDGDSIINTDFLFKRKLTYTRKKIDYKYKKFNSLYSNVFLDSDKNFIVNHMFFEKRILKKMLSEMMMNEKNFIKKISKELINKDVFFSEYQTYALYVKKTEKNYKILKTKVFRRFDLIFSKNIEIALNKYSLVSFEDHHNKSFLKIVYANILYRLGLNYG